MQPLNAEPTRPQPLVSCDWLAERLDDFRVRVIEVSSDPDGAAYRAGHIPRAGFWFWKDALWHATDREFATPAEMAGRLGAAGVTPDTTVVLYGDPVQYATYAFWVLTMAGHDDVRLLDGSRKRWTAEGRPLTTDLPDVIPAEYTPGAADNASRVGRDDVQANLGDPTRILLDVRTPEEFSGERVGPVSMGFDHGAERRGRIPGAVHLFYQDLLNEDDTFKNTDELKAKFLAAGVDSDGDTEVVTYCRLSHRATLAWFAMTRLLGMDRVKIYDGSWTEWGSIVGFPIAKD